MKIATIVLVCVLTIGSVAVIGDEAAGVPFVLPLPDGWGSETIPFPLDFAPELDYEGVEELRFAPGMFKEGTEDFWSYAFVWWVAADTVISADGLEDDLESYFSGLSRAVLEGSGDGLDGAVFGVELEELAEVRRDRFELTGTVQTFDPFVTKEQLKLNVRVIEIECPEQGRLAVYFELSPQASDHGVWIELAQIREGFRCSH